MVQPRVGGGRRLATSAATICVAALLGCGADDQIVSYKVPKESAATAPVPSETGEPVHRMLAAIVPEGGQAWIYKVVGPIPAVDAQADKILEFIATIPPAAGANLPAWQLPEGWKAKSGSDGFTLSTIQIPGADQPLDLTVSTVNWALPQEMLVSNVNRWRGQMGLPGHESPEQVSQDTREMKAGERTMIVANLKGTFRRGGMGGPFSGGAMSGAAPAAGARSGSSGSRPATGAMPPDHPPIDSQKTDGATDKSAAKAPTTSSTPASATPLDAVSKVPIPKFDAPASWSPMQAGGMNRAVFRLADADREAVVTVSTIPATTAASFSDPLSNANMWRTGVGLPELKPEQLAEATETIEVGGRPATLIRAIPGEDKREGTVGAVVTDGDHIWYFKLKGARQLVVDRQDEFLNFLKSIQFAN
jgi:hypothetical protein